MRSISTGAQEAEPKIVNVLVCKIRRKLRGSPWLIETVWGLDYRARMAADATMAA
jgi:DNA-binding response OmpR family regulator